MTKPIRPASNPYIRLMRLDKPIGIYLLAYPVLWSLLLTGTTDVKIWVIFLLGTLIMRSGGCIINDYADKDIDKHVERTNQRPLATGEIAPKSALLLFAVLMIIALGLVLSTNLLTLMLAGVAGLLTIIYPFAKRFFPVPQLFLSLAFAMSVPMTFAASLSEIPLGAWLVFAITVVWVIAYDTMYALSDKPDDLKIGVKSSAIYFGSWDKRIIGLLQVMMLMGLVVLGEWYTLHLVYYLGVGVVAGVMIYHQTLISQRNRTQCLKAFLHNNVIGLVVTISTALGMYL